MPWPPKHDPGTVRAQAIPGLHRSLALLQYAGETPLKFLAIPGRTSACLDCYDPLPARARLEIWRAR